MDFNLTEEQKKAALEAGKQGMKNAYEKSGTRPGLTWWERLLWVVLAGAAYAASSLLSGCGHTVDVTAERAEICRDDSCLVLEPGHLSYSQKQPKTEMPPVIRKIRQGKCLGAGRSFAPAVSGKTALQEPFRWGLSGEPAVGAA